MGHTYEIMASCVPLGRFVPWDVLSFGTFCPLGRFVPGMFCPWDLMSWDVLSWDVLSWDVLSLGTFSLGTFCLCTEEKAKVVATVWRTEFIKFFAVLAILQ